MKRVIFAVMLSVAFINAMAQDSEPVNEGKIIFEDVTKLEIKLEGDAAQFADMLPKERKSKKILYFNPEYALYKNFTESDTDNKTVTAVESESVMVNVQMVEPDNILFTNLKKGHQIEQREFMTRRFTINGKLIKHDWKFTENSKKIAGFNCMEAWFADEDGEKVMAWFTPEIQVASGPGKIAGLPGMILGVDYNNGKRTIFATTVEIEPVDKEHFKKPKKGKKVTQEEYDAIVQEKMKEMGSEAGNGSGSQAIIKIQR